MEEGSWYVQVLLRDDNTYQLEFRDGAQTYMAGCYVLAMSTNLE